MVEDKLAFTFFVREPRFYSFNMAANLDSSDLHLYDFLATDKCRVTEKLYGNNTFHHVSLMVRR